MVIQTDDDGDDDEFNSSYCCCFGKCSFYWFACLNHGHISKCVLVFVFNCYCCWCCWWCCYCCVANMLANALSPYTCAYTHTHYFICLVCEYRTNLSMAVSIATLYRLCVCLLLQGSLMFCYMYICVSVGIYMWHDIVEYLRVIVVWLIFKQYIRMKKYINKEKQRENERNKKRVKRIL